jgi:hypothetical protein
MLWSIKINSKLHYCCLLCYLLVRILLAADNDNGRRFGHHCPRRASNYIKIQEVEKKYTNFYVNIMNLLNRFDVGLGTNMYKTACPSGGLDSSNPHHWRAGRLHHHGGGVCYLFVLLWMDS